MKAIRWNKSTNCLKCFLWYSNIYFVKSQYIKSKEYQWIKESIVWWSKLRTNLGYSPFQFCLSIVRSKDIQYLGYLMVQRRAIRWTLNNFSPYDSVSQMQLRLGWRSLDQRRADARLCMLYKIIHGRVALPPYFQQPARMTRHSHPLHCAKGLQMIKACIFPKSFKF